MNDISCYPNPFNDEVSIELFTDGPAKTSIDVFNGNGQLIEHIIPATSLSHGNHLFKWNGRNGNGQKVTPGIYYIVVEERSRILHYKVVLFE
jgi:flagellar hook assembly protein FlgD